MSTSNPYNTPGPSPPYQKESSNELGLIGFILSLVGLFLCGVGVIGFIVSLLGLRREPKGFAIAGTIIGGLTTAFWGLIATIYGAMLLTCIGIGSSAVREGQMTITTRNAMKGATAEIQSYEALNGKLPDGIEGNKLILEYKDAWDHEMQYEAALDTDNGFRIRSAGRDGDFNTSDDILSDWPPNIDVKPADFDDDDDDSIGEPDIDGLGEPEPGLGPVTPDDGIPEIDLDINLDGEKPAANTPPKNDSGGRSDDPFQG